MTHTLKHTFTGIAFGFVWLGMLILAVPVLIAQPLVWAFEWLAEIAENLWAEMS